MKSDADVREAEKHAADQRLAGLRFLVVDESKAPTEDAKAQCGRLKKLVEDDPVKFDALLRQKNVIDLFSCGALFFRRAA